MAETYDILFKRRHPEIKKKEDVWDLIFRSYRGGTEFQDGSYLFQHAKESSKSFTMRKKRAVYFNQVQPLADILAGFLFIRPPARKNIGETTWIEFNADKKKKTMNEFMKIVATYSLLFTCGVLVDSPDFDTQEVTTEKDRVDRELHPYCILYYPFDIVDFHISDDDGKLDWIILDNSYYDNSDFLTEGVDKNVRRLWTRTYYQDFEQNTSGNSAPAVSVGDEVPHPIGEVPFKFVNWKDDDGDFISESVFEDIAMISRLIYNKMSEMDEMLASGSFRVLMYPSANGEIPPSLTAGGIGSLSAIPFDGNLGKAPFFDGAKLEEIEPFLKAIEFYISEILKKIGLDTDETKDYVKSGLSKKIDFQKVRTLLTSGAIALSSLETWIYAAVAKWMGKDSNAEVHYSTQYADEDIQVKVGLLNQLLVFPIEKLRKSVTSLLVKHLLTGELPQSELEEIYSEIEKSSVIEEDDEDEQEEKNNIEDLAAQERSAENQNN